MKSLNVKLLIRQDSKRKYWNYKAQKNIKLVTSEEKE